MYVEYKSISSKPDSSTYVPIELSLAQEQAVGKLDKKLKSNWDEWVAQELNLSKNELWQYFSAEQIDSIGLTIYNFKNNNIFIIADETGIGKGRILSAITRWAILKNKKVLFFTEREHLFSDFWRDLNDTNTLSLLTNPVLFHATARLYHNSEVILKGNATQVKNIEDSGFEETTNFVMTNYSQVSLKQHKKNKKTSLEEFATDNVIILDESHNAAGDSNTKKFLLNLIDKTNNIVYSSATFIKNESQLELYQRHINFDKESIDILIKLLKTSDDYILRKTFTYELTKRLQFWRREHQPLSIGWKTITCQNDELQQHYINEYANTINILFKLNNDIEKENNFQSLNLSTNWFSHGATINRLSRNLLLLLKLPTLVESVEKSLQNNHKAVIVLDSTFSSLINKVLEHKFQMNEDIEDIINIKQKNENITFGNLLHYIIDDIVLENLNKINNQKLFIDYQNLISKIKIFENLFLSPIDYIIDSLFAKGIKCNEVSGRKFKIINQTKVEKIKQIHRSQLVKQFNDGEVDVTLLTRAGASGLSLHASSTFKDQRVRDLYELEITNRPDYRLQFIGRVHRKNQVVEPEFYSVVTNLPFEQRIINVELSKKQKMRSHISGDTQNQDVENIINLYTKFCDEAAKNFLLNHPTFAKQMGINLRNPKEDLYYIDSLLKRCIILTNEQQNKLYDYLVYAKECENKLNLNFFTPDSSNIENIETYWHDLNDEEKAMFKQRYGKLPENSINQFYFPWVGLMTLKSTYNIESVYLSVLEKEYSKEIQNNYNHYFNDITNYLINHNNYNQQHLYQKILPNLKELKIGSSLIIKQLDYNIYGYLSAVHIPPIAKAHQYLQLCLLEIKTINPNLNENIIYPNNKYYMTLKDFIENENITIKNIPLNLKQFTRSKSTITRTSQFFIGNPIYMQFLQQAYNIGQIKYKPIEQITGKNYMYIQLPHNIEKNYLKNLPKPIYNSSKIMQLLIDKKIKNLTTTWQDEHEIKPSLKLETIKGGYKLYIATEIWRNFELIDFPLRKRLKNKAGQIFGYETFIIAYKDIRGLLWALEQKEVIWFVKE